MSRLVRPVGLALIVFGLLVALFPFISVWRVSGEVLEQLPQVSGADTIDERNRLGVMFDDDFVLAQRTYTGVTNEIVVDALSRGGFETSGVGAFSKRCCGEYDAVWVDLGEGDSGSVAAVLTVADDDVRATWSLFAGLGVLVALAGLAAVGLVGGGWRPGVTLEDERRLSELRS